MKHAADRLYEALDKYQTPLCVGLDPNLKLFPPQLLQKFAGLYGSNYRAAADAIKWFNFSILDATSDLVGVVKPQSAYYEQYGSEGIRALEETVKYAQSLGKIVILDAKRGDIGPTSQAYADAHLGQVLLPDGSFIPSPDSADFMTVNGYLGSDGIEPFIEVCNTHGKGIFILAKTSNPSSGELQDLLLADGPVYQKLGELINNWGSGNIGESGYSNIGAVVGATYPEEASLLRDQMPNTLFLLPGYGAQGAKADILTNGFSNNGRGAVVNSTRSTIYAFMRPEFKSKHPDLANPLIYMEAARQATLDAILDINTALNKVGKLPSGWSV